MNLIGDKLKKLILATTKDKQNDALEEYALKENIIVFIKIP